MSPSNSNTNHNISEIRCDGTSIDEFEKIENNPKPFYGGMPHKDIEEIPETSHDGMPCEEYERIPKTFHDGTPARIWIRTQK